MPAITKPPQAKASAPVQKNPTRLARLVVEWVPTGKIQPNPYNPNRQDEATFDLLVKSIQEDGFTVPILVHQPTSQIIDGEHRWRAARHLKMPQVPVIMTHMTAEQMRIATLRHNRARGKEEAGPLASVFAELQAMGAMDWALDSLAMDQADVDSLLSTLTTEDPFSGIDTSTPSVPGGEDETPTQGSTDSADDVLRVSLVFTGHDAAWMREFLGPDPSSQVLALARGDK